MKGLCRTERLRRGPRALILRKLRRGRKRLWELLRVPGHKLLKPTQSSTIGKSTSLRVRMSAVGGAVRHVGSTHAQIFPRHEGIAKEICGDAHTRGRHHHRTAIEGAQGGAHTRHRHHHLKIATENTLGGDHILDFARRHRGDRTAVEESEARRRIERVSEIRGGG